MPGHYRWNASRDAWEVVVDLGTIGGRRRRRTRLVRGSEDEAKEVLADMLREVQEGVLPSSQTVAWYLMRWIEGRRDNLKPTGYQAYERAIRLHIAPRIGRVRLDKLTAVDLQALYADLRKAGLAPKYVRFVHATLRKALGDAERMRLLRYNPAAAVEPPRVPPRRELRTLTPQEAAMVLAAAKDERHGDLIIVALLTGLRLGELLALTWSDVDLDGAMIHVSKSVFVSRQTGVVVGPPKTKYGVRDVALVPQAVAALRRQKRTVAEMRLAAGPRWHDHDLVFPARDGRHLAPQAVSHRWEHIRRRLGLDGVRFHDLRHTWVTLSLIAGGDPLTVSREAGHASPGFTLDVYGHLTVEAQRRRADLLSKLLGGEG
ncbi:MAG: site-specific integrase [Firmicutes bacterium]|nr:site-specific integrase [Bacillota bacterium]MBE3590870.1 site-specific integrase [Bacillota bacterium]